MSTDAQPVTDAARLAGGAEADPKADRRPTGDRLAEQAVLALARQCRYERDHAHQVERLALELFDALVPLHGLGPEDRRCLRWAAILHDIGVAEGPAGHHRRAFRLILHARDLPLPDRERVLVALVARYHRKALPKRTHPHFASLGSRERRRVRTLAAILRVADGLDRTHRSAVRGTRCEIGPAVVRLRCKGEASQAEERLAASAKADLFERVFRRTLIIETPDDVIH